MTVGVFLRTAAVDCSQVACAARQSVSCTALYRPQDDYDFNCSQSVVPNLKKCLIPSTLEVSVIGAGRGPRAVGEHAGWGRKCGAAHNTYTPLTSNLLCLIMPPFALQEAAAICNDWGPRCQGFAWAPHGITLLNYSFAVFKASQSGQPVDMAASFLTPSGISYFKVGQVLQHGDSNSNSSGGGGDTGRSGGGGGLSAGAVAGAICLHWQ